ncbi:hypothetical protein [Providencia hangzhouensis]
MGATPTPLPLAEVYTALNLKIIDGGATQFQCYMQTR